MPASPTVGSFRRVRTYDDGRRKHKYGQDGLIMTGLWSLSHIPDIVSWVICSLESRARVILLCVKIVVHSITVIYTWLWRTPEMLFW